MALVPSVVRPELPEGVERAIDALGNRVKYAAIRSLVVDGPATQTELAERIAVKRALLRKHLVMLEGLGVLVVSPDRSQTDTRRRTFTVNRTELRAMMDRLQADIGLS